jgi:FkbM family methyltransferase
MRTTSRIFDAFPDESSFLDDLMRHVQPQRYVLVNRDGRHFVAIEGHYDVPHGPARPRRFSVRNRPNSHAYEPVVTLMLSRLIQRFHASSVFDIGASGGYFAMIAASAIEAAPIVHAFEMQPHCVQRIEALASLDHYGARIVPHLCGMSDAHRGEREIWYSLTKMYETRPNERLYREAWWRRAKFWLKGRKDRDELKRATVTVTSVDHFCKVNALAPDIIKVDVDGYEAKVVPGALQTLRAHRPFLLFELHRSKFLKPFNQGRRDVVKPLFELGYKALFCEDHNDITRNRFRIIGAQDPSIDRERTDFLLFF